MVNDAVLVEPAGPRGTCPECGGVLVSHWYYTEKRGYTCYWECFGSLADVLSCEYRRVK